ncbi:MAG TPA: hypothetical protein VIQ29_01900 [Ancylobacter sp.]|uniref:hypothetical protein n=1 Tax=Xanthobacter autotrophicus TaxID=280 RepID=UPI002FBA4E1E
MDWYADCSYHAERKRRFHATARARLRQLVAELRLPAGRFDLRSIQGGIAVSGEITLHGEQIYVQVCQPATRADTGILIRTCRDRRDYCGGANHFAPLSLLDDIPTLAAQVRAVMATGPGASRAA